MPNRPTEILGGRQALPLTHFQAEPRQRHFSHNTGATAYTNLARPDHLLAQATTQPSKAGVPAQMPLDEWQTQPLDYRSMMRNTPIPLNVEVSDVPARRTLEPTITTSEITGGCNLNARSIYFYPYRFGVRDLYDYAIDSNHLPAINPAVEKVRKLKTYDLRPGELSRELIYTVSDKGIPHLLLVSSKPAGRGYVIRMRRISLNMIRNYLGADWQQHFNDEQVAKLQKSDQDNKRSMTVLQFTPALTKKGIYIAVDFHVQRVVGNVGGATLCENLGPSFLEATITQVMQNLSIRATHPEPESQIPSNPPAVSNQKPADSSSPG